MIVAYNKPFVGDVLLVQLAAEKIVNTQVEKVGDIAILKEEATGEIKAFNIFNASKYINLDLQGKAEITPELVQKIEDALKENEVTISLDVDFTPKFVVGYVEEKEKHPNADKLSICKVNVGDEVLQIVCGAPNVEAGQKVVVAKIGAVMPSGLVIKDSELRGVASSGMLCSARELAIPNAPSAKGILVLDYDVEVGSPFETPTNL
jgi:tRNA-binding protein